MGTAAVVVLLNAFPLIVDILSETYCIDPDKIEQAITPKTKAIIPVHLGSKVADMDKIMAIANNHNLTVIEDCAHAHAATWGNKGVGSIGHLGCFSFFQTKMMTSGEGGIILTNNRELGERCESYINCGRLGDNEENKYNVVGWNYRLTEFQAGILLSQLQRLPEQDNRRKQNVSYLEEKIAEIKGVDILQNQDKVGPRVGFMYIFKYNTEEFGGLPRDKFVAAMVAENIPCYGCYYPPVYKSPLLPLAEENLFCPKDSSKNKYYADLFCPVAEKAAFEESVWLPHQLFLGNKEDMDNIIDAIIKIRENIKELLES